MLAIIACGIMERLYAVHNKAVSPTAIWSEARSLEKELLAWENDLPLQLRLDSQEAISRAPPHLLTLHMQKECAVIVLQLPL